MTHHFGKALVAAALALAGFSAGASSVVTYSGNLGDAGNTALVGSGDHITAPDFTTPEDNVALYQLQVAHDGTLTLASSGFGQGHLDTYLTLFSGSDYSAVFVGSAQDDFNWSLNVTAGSYWVAIGDWENFSFEENWGSGTLASGFIGIGDPNWYADGAYDVTATLDTGVTPPPAIPEPSQAALLMLGLAAVATRAWRARRAH